MTRLDRLIRARGRALSVAVLSLALGGLSVSGFAQSGPTGPLPAPPPAPLSGGAPGAPPAGAPGVPVGGKGTPLAARQLPTGRTTYRDFPNNPKLEASSRRLDQRIRRGICIGC